MNYDKKMLIQYVSKDNFNDLGEVIKIPQEGEMKPLLESSFFKHYGPLGFIEGKEDIEFGITTFKKRELIAEKLEQHAQTQELLYAIDGDFIMPVAPIIHKEGEAFPDEEKIRIIRVPQGVGVIFKKGYWHWAPFPIKDTSSVLVGFKKGTAEKDIIIRELKEKILMIEEEK
jgi:ureidoglycolate hydrolase